MSDNNDAKKNPAEADASVSTFVSSAIFTVAVSSILFLAFAILRSRFPRVYAPKTYMGPDRERPDTTSKGLLGWIFGGRRLNELEFVEKCGLDAYMFMDFLNKSFFLFLGFSILAIPILIPLNAYRQLSLVGLNQFTIGNVADQKRLWGHLILTVLFCLTTLAMGILGVRRYITRRQHYLLTEHHSQSLQATTILVCGIPIGDETLQSLHSIFNVFPGGVKRIWPAYSADDLQKDVLKRITLTDKLETAECALIRAKLKHQTGGGTRRRPSGASSTNMLNNQEMGGVATPPFPPEKKPQHRPAVFPMSLFASCCGAEKVDSVSTYRQELAELDTSITTRQLAGIAAMHENEDENKLSAAFVQFNSQLGAHLAAQAVIHRKTLTMQPRHLEVHPKDVVWVNLGHSLKERNIRRAIAAVLAFLLIALWTIPVAFVASVAKLDAIVRFAPFLKGVYDLPKVVVGIIQGILPPVGLAVLMMVLPIILYKLTHLSGEVLNSRKTLSVITSFHWFSVVHVLTTLANGIFAAVQQIKDNPSAVMSMLSSTLPQASTFFLSFILLSFIQIPLMLLQIGPLIMFWVSKWRATTPRQVYAAERTMGFVDWGTTIPVHTIAFAIGLIYSTIQPIILPLMVFYFGLYYLAFRYQFLYVYRQPFDSGGLIFPRIVDQVYIALIIYEIVMLGLFVLQKASGQAAIMFVLLLVSIAAIVISRNSVFKPLIQYLPVEAFDAGGGKSLGHHGGDNFAGVGGKSSKDEIENVDVEAATTSVTTTSAAATTSAATTSAAATTAAATPTAAGYKGFGSTGGPSTLAFNPAMDEKGITDPDSMAFVNPGLRTQKQPVWLPRDPAGFTDTEISELNESSIANTTESATMDTKGKVAVEVSQHVAAPGDEFWE
ncbi:hypothetical protein BGZ95_009437 [Linnemannia exigua]|uniref:DUF221-domain-containing protein n=1 Tax=Linnemannia exigua TaxID=604196 RepID=A0AAD4H6M7_9FUNG|nr:hypothetical protein BGZ95_009437 [Linnemannia exigua]